MKDPARVLEELEEILDALGEAARSGAVLVEGRRDAAALHALGVAGAIEVLNRGASVLAVCDALADRHGAVTVLTDWDRKGDALALQLAAGLARSGTAVDSATREQLRRLTRGAIRSVEELPSFHRRVAAAAASKGPSVKVATGWQARKEENLERAATRKQHGAPPGRRP